MACPRITSGEHVHRTYIGSAERGERNIALLAMDRLASGLDVTLAELMSRMESRR